MELSLITGLFVGAASAYLGSIMVLKRLALVGDALSHVALPGIAVALTYHLNPFLGAFTALALGVVLIWQIEQRTTIPTEAIVGLIFSSALAIGILITPEPELLEALFGDISKVNLTDTIFAVIASLAIFLVIFLIRKKLLLSLVAPDLAKSQGVKVDLLNLIFLFLVAGAVALGVKVVGSLLMGSLVIIPAVSAKNIASNMKSYGFVSAVFGMASAVGGILIASHYGLLPGPLVVLTSAGIFLFTLAFKK